jgi:hypothetical protein
MAGPYSWNFPAACRMPYQLTAPCLPRIRMHTQTFDQMISDASLDEIASYAAGAGPYKVGGWSHHPPLSPQALG